MECQQCGAPLRPQARFCNVCGARQTADAVSQPAATPTTPGTDQMGEAGSSSGRAKRPPRVPRTDQPDASRTRETAAPVLTDVLDLSDASGGLAAAEEQRGDASTAGSAGIPSAPAHAAATTDAELAEGVDVDTDATSDASSDKTSDATPDATQDAEALATGDDLHVEGDRVPASAEPSTPDESEASEGSLQAQDHAVRSDEYADADAGERPPEVDATDGEAASAPVPGPASDWTEAETAEYSTIIATGHPRNPAETAALGGAPGMPAIGELLRASGEPHAGAEPQPATTRADGLPWPLPPSIIVGGRYRVEAVISNMPEASEAENVYRVRDLQGYERCWSCGTAHGASASADTYCQECGADMLARDYLMSERYRGGEADGSEAQTAADAAAAPTEGVGAARAADDTKDTKDTKDAKDADDADAERTELDVRIFTQGARSYRVTPLAAETPLFPRGTRVTAAGATDTGISRAGEVNEDSLGLVVLAMAHESRAEPFALAVVADGLGGHANGQAASRLVVRHLSERILRVAALPFTGEPRAAAHATFEALALSALREGIEAGNDALCAQNAASGADMGSTLVALLLFGATAYIANVGDSRAYVLDDDGLRRITSDHSLVEQLIAAGEVAEEDRYTHPRRNQILRSIGDEPNVQVDVFQQQLRPGMRFLLCSDGLWEMVRDDEIERLLREAASPQQATDLLLRAANSNGGEDNVTAIVVEVSD